MLTIPPDLKKITPYVRRAEELDRDQSSPGSRLVAYYCRQYAVQTGIPLSGSSPEAKTCLGELLGNLEKEKPAMDNFTRDEAAFLCRKFANQVFDKADGEDRLGMATKNTAKTFYAAASFLQILDQFSDESDESEARAEDKKRIIYAKWKATEIIKAMNEGRKPTPGGYGEEEEDEEEEEAMEEDKEPEKETPTIETVTEDDDGSKEKEEEAAFEPPAAPIAPMVPPVPPPAEEEEPKEVPPPETTEMDEDVEVELGAPPAYPGSDAPPPPASKPPSVSRPPVTFDLPPPPDVPPPPVPPPAEKSSGIGSIFGFGNKSKSKATRAQMADAVELTRFALAALEDRDADLGAERLQQALKALGH